MSYLGNWLSGYSPSVPYSGSGGGGGDNLGQGNYGVVGGPTRSFLYGIPPYFDLTNMSPIAINFLKQLFPETTMTAEDTQIPEGGSQLLEGARSYSTKTGQSLIPTAMPEMMSAQTMKGVKSAGLWDQIMNYADLYGAVAKQSWLDQAMGAMPSANTTKPAQYKTARQK